MKKTIIALFLLVFTAPSFSFAQNAADQWKKDFDRGKQLFAAGQFGEAYNAFFKAFRENPADLDISFYLGRAAYEKGDYEAALMAYERILLMDPQATRVKLEIARTYLQLRSREIAKQYFKEVLATNPPESVWKNIEKFLAAIEEAERKHFVNGTITAGIDFDDNIRSSPSGGTIDVGLGNLIPITILAGAPQHDKIYTTTAVVNHIYKFTDSRLSWKTTGINYNAFYDKNQTLDINFFGVNSGPVLLTDAYQWEAHGLVNYMDYEYDRYFSSAGVGTSALFFLGQNVFFNVGVNIEERNFYQDGGKDAANIAIAAGPVLALGANRISVTLSKEHNDAASDYNTYDRAGFFLRYDRSLPCDVSLFASFKLEDTVYKAPDAFNVKRSDHLRVYSFGMSSELWRSDDRQYSVAALLQHAYTDADSSNGLYAYRKNVTTASVTFAF